MRIHFVVQMILTSEMVGSGSVHLHAAWRWLPFTDQSLLQCCWNSDDVYTWSQQRTRFDNKKKIEKWKKEKNFTGNDVRRAGSYNQSNKQMRRTVRKCRRLKPDWCALHNHMPLSWCCHRVANNPSHHLEEYQSFEVLVKTAPNPVIPDAVSVETPSADVCRYGVLLAFLDDNSDERKYRPATLRRVRKCWKSSWRHAVDF